MSRPIKGILFDLDNTLYNEQEYISHAFEDISQFLSERFPTREEDFYSALLSQFKEKGSLYPRLFDDTLDNLGLYDEELVKQMVDIFRQSTPKIKLYDQAKDVLHNLKDQYVLALITNGNVGMQQRKVQLLGISDFFQKIVYAQVHGKEEKPSVLAYEDALQGLNMKPREVIYVGDNPYTDFIGAKKLGIATVRLLMGEFAHVVLSQEYEADYAIEELSGLFEVLDLIVKDERR